MRKPLVSTLAALIGAFCIDQAAGAELIRVPVTDGDATPVIQAAIEQARALNGKPVTIRLEQGDYDLHRESSSKSVYYISNTASEKENPDPTKHIGLLLKGLKNVTFDGGGALLVTHGEMSAFVVDGCENVTLRNFRLTAADPTVPEMTVEDAGERYITARLHPDSQYGITDGKFRWEGDGWQLEGGIAQCFDPATNVTWRCESPLTGIVRAIELEPGLVRFYYERRPDGKPGQVFQMRDGIRDQVCGFIHRSKNVTLENLDLYFMGNFGIVGQYSENLTYDHIRCTPEPGRGRTCAGFADFVQMSGCKGTIRITDSYFEGAHDDPINIHGTHLKITGYEAPDRIRVRFMHDQSYGFEAFFKDDQIEITDAHTLRCLQSARIKKAETVDAYEIVLTLDKAIDPAIREREAVVENITWTPEVVIRNNYFARTPTRGVLISTRRKIVIENNLFFRTPMSAILIADDARSWYESGPVHDATIEGNTFVECGAPVIAVSPENDRYEGAVHRNIRILSNRFILRGNETAVSARSTDGLDIRGNYFVTAEPVDPAALIRTENCNETTVEGNRNGRAAR